MARRRALPFIAEPTPQTKEFSNFIGMDNTTQPELLNDRMLTNIQNGHVQNGIIVKRNGHDQDGIDLPDAGNSHNEPFTATTKRDAATTADWSTDGSSNLLANLTASVATSITMLANQRGTFISSNGTIVILYSDGSSIYGKKSTDNGTTWVKLDGTAGATTIYTFSGGAGLNAFTGFSGFIDSSDHIHIAYSYDDDFGQNYSLYKKLTYNSGSWTLGSQKTISNNGGYKICIIVDSSNKIWTVYSNGSNSTGQSLYCSTSTNGGDNWTETTIDSLYSGLENYNYNLVLNNNSPVVMASEGSNIKIYSYSTSWSLTTTIGASSTVNYLNSCILSTNNIWVIYNDSNGIRVCKFNGSTISDTSTLSSDTNDILPRITTDGTYLWAIWGNYESASQFEVTHKRYVSGVWATQEDTTTGNYNLVGLDVPQTNLGTYIPYIGIGTTTLFAKVHQLSGLVQSIGYDSTTTTNSFIANVTQSLNSGTITISYADSANNTDWSAWTTDITTLTRRYIKFKIVFSTVNLNSPTVTSIIMIYGGLPVVSGGSWTKGAEHYRVAIAGTNFYVKTATMDWLKIKSNLTTGLKATFAKFSSATVPAYLIIGNGIDAMMRFNGKVTTGTNVTVGGAGHTTVTGSGTKWNTASHADQLIAGGRIKLTSTWYTIASITSDTVLEITVASTDGAHAYEAYSVVTLAGSPPTGKYVIAHKNQVLICGVATALNNLYISEIGDATNWTTGNAGAVKIGSDDGMDLNGMIKYKDIVLLTKYDSEGTNKAVYGLYGSDRTDYRADPLTDEYSSVSNFAMASSGDHIYMLDRKGIVKTNGITFNLIDLPIEEITQNLNQAYLDLSCAAFHDDKILFSVPYLTSTINNRIIEIDLKTGGYAIHTGVSIGCFIRSSVLKVPTLFFGTSQSISKVFQWDDTTNDEGQPIDFIVEKKGIEFNKFFVEYGMRYLYAKFKSTGAYDVTASYAIDSGAYVALEETVEVSGSTDVYKRWVLPGLSGSTIDIKFENNEADQPISLIAFGLEGEAKGSRR